MKIGFVFAGQGSQNVGMGKSFYDHYEKARQIYDALQLDFNIKDLSFNGPIETLSQTRYTQPCMVALAIIAVELLKDNGIQPKMTAGLSLGEYSALYTAGVFDKQTVIDLVYFRGQAMEKAAQGIDSKMVAVLGLDRETLQQCCDEASELGVVQIANYNCPGQLVIGGEKQAVEKASELALAHKAKRALPLNTSGPFHTSLLEQASHDLADKFKTVEFHDMQVPVIFNATARPLEEGKTIAEMLEKQVKSSVYFEDTIRYMIASGIDTIIEIGPGKVLSGFVRKIDKSIKCYQVEDHETLLKTIAGIKGE